MEPTEVMENIFTVNLGVRKEEEVLVFTDLIAPGEKMTAEETARRTALRETAREVAEAGRPICKVTYLEYPSLGGHGKEPPEEAWQAAFGEKAVRRLTEDGVLERILEKAAKGDDIKRAEAVVRDCAVSPSAVVALSNFSTSHTRFRDLLTRCMRSRYASMPIFERSMLEGVMTADWHRVEERTLRLAELVSGGSDIFITSHNGTSISFSIKDRAVEPDTGILTEPGTFGNLPAGEAFLAPVEGTAEGLMVLEWAPTRRLRKPVSLVVKKGLVVEVDGTEDLAYELRDRLKENPMIGNIAELGIGTNDKAERPDNILETEKILGTIHLALGDNSSFGGKVSVPFHQDFIFFRPTVEVVKDGVKAEVLVEGVPRF